MLPHLIAFLPDSVPTSWYDPLLLPLFLSGAGVAIYLMGRAAEFKMQGKWKWWSLAPLVLALYLGFRPMSYLFDVVYRASAEEYGKKMILAHYAGFFIPLFCIAGAVLWNFLDSKSESAR